MDLSSALFAVVAVAVLGLVAVLAILRRERRADEEARRDSPFAASTEGMKRCPTCGTANLVTDSNCSNCGRRLPG